MATVGWGAENGTARFLLSLPSTPELIGIGRLFAASIARQYGCDEELTEDVKVAVSEACTNAVKVHRDGAISEPIEITGRLKDDELWFEIIDAGPGFDYQPPVE